MKEVKISAIDLLAYPDFEASVFDNGKKLHARQLELRNGWDRRIENISREPGVILVYFSILDINQISSGWKSSDSLLSAIEKEEIKRQQKYNNLLRERLLIIPRDVPVTKDLLGKKLKQNGLIFSPENSRLTAYGEYTENGVVGRRNDVRVALGISGIHIGTDCDLSLSIEQQRQITRWRARNRDE